MSRRGKDDGFHPHPGDPWSPGWTSGEPDTEEETPEEGRVAPESGPRAPSTPPPGLDTGALETAVESAAAEVKEVTAAGEAGWTEVLGVRPEVPGRVAPTGAAEGVPEVSFGGAQAQLPLEAGSAEPEAEPEIEHLPPPWAPEEAEAAVEPVESAQPAHLPPPWAPEAESARLEPPGTEAAATEELEMGAVREPAEPGWEVEAAEGWAPAGVPAVAGEEGTEVEVEEWLSFAAGEGPGAEVPTGEPSMVEEVAEARPARRRFWPFGRRGRPAEEPPMEWTEEEAGGVVAGEEPEPLPWPPEADVEEGLLGTDLPAEATEESAWEEEGWEQPIAEEPLPPPWMPQSELDRAAPIPIIPVGMPGDESAEAEGPAAYPDAWFAGEAEPAGPFPTVPPEEEAEDWEALPEPGQPIVAAEPSREVEAPGEEWGESAGFEEAGALTMEIPPPEAAGYPAARREITSGEVLAGAVTSEHRDLAEEVAAADTAEAQLQALSAPMAGLESGVVGFEDVDYLGGEEEYAERPRSDLPTRVLTGMVLVGILLGAMWVGGEFLAGFVGLLAILALGELYGTLRRAGYQPLALFGFLGAIGLLAGAWFYGLVAIPVAVVALTIVCFFYYSLASRRRDPLTNGSLTLLGVLWVAGPIAFVFPIAVAPDFRVLVLAAAATVIATDVGAFFAGRSWGSRLLAPVLSPNKTVEGLAGGVVLGIAVAVFIGYFLEPLNIRIGAGLGLVVAVAAPLGDVAESMIKRSLGVKDMGTILPGHGGILDRIDAYLFVLPAVWVLYETLGLLR